MACTLYKADADSVTRRSFPKLRQRHAPQENCSRLRFFEVFADGESFPQFFADREVVVAAEAAVKNCLGFLDIRQPVRAQDILVGENAQDFSDENRVQPELMMLEKTAFQGKGQFAGKRSVHALAFERREARVPELIVIATRDEADIVGSLNVFP
jgi:hypothetical protein